MKRFQHALLGIALGALFPDFGPSAFAADGPGLFVKNCAPCHGKDGKASTPMARKLGVKDLTGSKLDDEAIKKQIVEGRRNDKGSQVMPSYEGKLTDEEINALIAVVKAFRTQDAEPK